MSLIDCPDWGHRVSTRAAACPSCGAPPPQEGDDARGSAAGTAAGARAAAPPRVAAHAAAPAGGRSPAPAPPRSRTPALAAAGVIGTLVLLAIASAAVSRLTSGSDAPAADSAAAAPAMDDSPAAFSLGSVGAAPPPPPPPPSNLCDEYDTARRIDSLAPVILRQRGEFGDRMHATVQNCAFYPREDIARVNVVLGWNGGLTSRPYELAGVLVLSRNDWAFTAGAGNENLNALEGEQKKAVGAAALLVLLGAALASSGDTPAPPPPAAAAPPDVSTGETAVCLTNEAEQTLYFSWRQVQQGSSWTNDSLLPNRSYRWRSAGMDTVALDLDESMAATNDRRQYVLPHTPTSDTSCDSVTRYALSVSADTIRVFRR